MTARVFWAWNHPDRNQWEAPDHERWEYGNSRALYKLYFSSQVQPNEQTIEDNIAARFAEIAIPYVNAALFPDSPGSPGSPESRVESPESGPAAEASD